VRFNPDGSIAAAYRILGGTNVNCAGGATPRTRVTAASTASSDAWGDLRTGRVQVAVRAGRAR
jgi:hypothetical protein